MILLSNIVRDCSENALLKRYEKYPCSARPGVTYITVHFGMKVFPEWTFCEKHSGYGFKRAIKVKSIKENSTIIPAITALNLPYFPLSIKGIRMTANIAVNGMKTVPIRMVFPGKY